MNLSSFTYKNLTFYKVGGLEGTEHAITFEGADDLFVSPSIYSLLQTDFDITFQNLPVVDRNDSWIINCKDTQRRLLNVITLNHPLGPQLHRIYRCLFDGSGHWKKQEANLIMPFGILGESINQLFYSSSIESNQFHVDLMRPIEIQGNTVYLMEVHHQPEGDGTCSTIINFAYIDLLHADMKIIERGVEGNDHITEGCVFQMEHHIPYAIEQGLDHDLLQWKDSHTVEVLFSRYNVFGKQSQQKTQCYTTMDEQLQDAWRRKGNMYYRKAS